MFVTSGVLNEVHCDDVAGRQSQGLPHSTQLISRTFLFLMLSGQHETEKLNYGSHLENAGNEQCCSIQGFDFVTRGETNQVFRESGVKVKFSFLFYGATRTAGKMNV